MAKNGEDDAYQLVEDVRIEARHGVICADVQVGGRTVRLALGFSVATRAVRQAAKALAKENVVAFGPRRA